MLLDYDVKIGQFRHNFVMDHCSNFKPWSLKLQLQYFRSFQVTLCTVGDPPGIDDQMDKKWGV